MGWTGSDYDPAKRMSDLTHGHGNFQHRFGHPEKTAQHFSSLMTRGKNWDSFKHTENETEPQSPSYNIN